MGYDPGEKRGPGELVVFFRDHLLRAQECSISMSRKSSKGSRRPALKNKLLLTKLKHKRQHTGGGDRDR